VNLIVETAPLASSRIVCLDCLDHVSAQTAADLAGAGYAAIGRYINLSEGLGGYSITPDELDGITRSLGCWAIQEARTGGWSDVAGFEDGRAAARNALAAGFPPGTRLVCDFEGSIPHTVAIGYANQWHRGALIDAGSAFSPAIYIGAGVPLDSQALFHNLAFRSYWRALSQVPNVAQRGYQLLQLFPDDQEVLGPGRGRFDLNVAQSDYLGDRWAWAKAA
jgi:hypothetical protein